LPGNPDLVRRAREHREGVVAGFPKNGPKRLVYEPRKIVSRFPIGQAKNSESTQTANPCRKKKIGSSFEVYLDRRLRWPIYSCIMILYHFTTIEALGITGAGLVDISQCWPNGILPHAATAEAEAWMCPDPVVWLTADADPGGDNEGLCVRLAVRITSTDRRLVEFDKWMRRRVGKKEWLERPEILVRTQPWRLYFGTIRAAAIVGAVGCHRPWWRAAPLAFAGDDAYVPETPRGRTARSGTGDVLGRMSGSLISYIISD
jgi:hypothetical protein